jgi:hypothetical protein
MTRARHGWLLLSSIEICIQNQSAGFIPAHMNQIVMKRAELRQVLRLIAATLGEGDYVMVFGPSIAVAPLA